MSKGCVALLLFLCLSAAARQAQLAHAIYARNGVLVGLTDLAPLRDCPVRGMEGKSRAIKIDDDNATFELKAAEQRISFRFPLSRLDTADRKALRRGLLRKGLLLRASGYACGGISDQPLETISINWVY